MLKQSLFFDTLFSSNFSSLPNFNPWEVSLRRVMTIEYMWWRSKHVIERSKFSRILPPSIVQLLWWTVTWKKKNLNVWNTLMRRTSSYIPRPRWRCNLENKKCCFTGLCMATLVRCWYPPLESWENLGRPRKASLIGRIRLRAHGTWALTTYSKLWSRWNVLAESRRFFCPSTFKCKRKSR